MQTARLIAVEFLGSLTRVDLDVEGVTIQALVTPDTAHGLSAGSRVPVSLPPEFIWVQPQPA
jgi:hypothetical protein